MTKELNFPHGLHLLARWQEGDGPACKRLTNLLEEAIEGRHDDAFAQLPPPDQVHASGSINLLTLTLLFRLLGITSDDFYLHNPERYVRTTMLTRRLLGFNKLYLSWPVYAFTAQVLGQEMLYPDQFPPGTDPGVNLAGRDNWRDIATPDLTSGIPAHLENMLSFYEGLTGMDPVLHLSAPYSLAADIFGQEELLGELTHDPAFVNQFLDHLADQVHAPWIDRHLARFPDGWVELSDASGSPFFIGPEKCRDVAIRSIQRLKARHPWGERVYIANYRGDYVARALETKSARGGRRRTAAPSPAIGLTALSDIKQSVCPGFVIRLDDDRIEPEFYADQAKERTVPLFLGIGAGQIDRNSAPDTATSRDEAAALVRRYTDLIGTVAGHLKKSGYTGRKPPWPGAIYFEDISGESNFALVERMVQEVIEHRIS